MPHCPPALPLIACLTTAMRTTLLLPCALFLLCTVSKKTRPYDATNPLADHTARAIHHDENGNTHLAVLSFRAALKFSPSATAQQHLGTALTTHANGLDDNLALPLYEEALHLLLQSKVLEDHPMTTESIEIVEYNCWRRYTNGCDNAVAAASASKNMLRVETAQRRLLVYMSTHTETHNTDNSHNTDNTDNTDNINNTAYSIWDPLANHHEKALSYMNTSKWNWAIRSMRAAIASDPTSPALRNNLGVLCMSIVRDADQQGGQEYASVWLLEAKEAFTTALRLLEEEHTTHELAEAGGKQVAQDDRALCTQNIKDLERLSETMLEVEKDEGGMEEEEKEQKRGRGRKKGAKEHASFPHGTSKNHRSKKRKKKVVVNTTLYPVAPPVTRLSWKEVVMQTFTTNSNSSSNSSNSSNKQHQQQLYFFLSQLDPSFVQVQVRNWLMLQKEPLVVYNIPKQNYPFPPQWSNMT